MKPIWGIFLVTILAWGCARQDPFARLQAKMEQASTPSYLYTPIKLPETATSQQCIAELTHRGELKAPSILEIRPLHTYTWREDFTAVLLDSAEGRKIVVLRPQLTHGWYFRIYDAP